MANKTRKRVEVSDSTLEQLQTLADFYGHGDPKAALATLAKFGVPMLLGTEVAFSSKPTTVQTQIETTPHKCGETRAANFPG